MLGVRHLKTTSYQPQTNRLVKMYKLKIITRRRNYVVKNQRDRNMYVQPLTYVYNTHLRNSTGTSPFSLVLSRHPQRPTTANRPNVLTSDTYIKITPTAVRLLLQRKRGTLQEKVDTR